MKRSTQLLILTALCACTSCHRMAQGDSVPPAASPAKTADKVCTLLSVNDTYRIESLPDGTGGLARVRALRARLEAERGPVLLLHAGDFLYPSILSRTYKGAQMVDVLNQLDGSPSGFDERMFITFGNHEFDDAKEKAAADLSERINSSQFLWLASNIVFRPAAEGRRMVDSPHLKDTAIVDCGEIKTGLFSITTSEKSAAYVERFLDPVQVAESKSRELREQGGVDLVVALTHQSMAADVALLEALGDRGPDIIIGGHEHTQQQRVVGGRGIYKADADGRSAFLVTLRPASGGRWETQAQLLPLGEGQPEDPQVRALVEEKLSAHDALFCGKVKRPTGCLSDVVGQARTKLVAEELEIRKYETNLGNWIVDLARSAYPDADIAFLNSGALRLNQDIPPGPIRRLQMEELLAYSLPLVRIELDGETLQKVLNRSIQGWTGGGHWLQISGFAYVHDPKAMTASHLTLLTPKGPRTLTAKDKLVAVVPQFLVDPAGGQDGYTMLQAGTSSPGPDLKELVYAALARAGNEGLSPTVEGRICNMERPGPCLALRHP
ncbi:MAG TPA: bifunctional metallophosphatase/5'-nucleotidase [Hyalangium sp.]|nr:bifunctional metallophosphatase/5'-nucleotidase [Hyalangium sp.]